MNKKIINILLVEDDKDDYLLFKKYLEKVPIKTTLEWESSYESGIKRLRVKSDFDLCFVDYHLGEKNGIDFIKEVSSRGLPQAIIMLTGQGDETLGIEAVRYGAEDFYSKLNINPETLNRAINFTVERRRAREQEQELRLAQIEKRIAQEQQVRLSELLEKVAEQAALLQAANDAFIVLDKKNIIYSWNKGAERLYGYTEKETLGKKSYDILKTVYPEPLPTIHAKINKNSSWQGELTHTKSNGEIVIVDSKWELLRGGKDLLYLEVNRDITERKRLEKQKDDFLGIASHELKTPVTSIKAFAQVLANRFAKRGDQESTKLLQKMDAQINKLTLLINDLLDVTKIEGGKLQFNEIEFDFDTLVEEIIEEVQRTTAKHTLILEGKTKKIVFGDRDRLGQVITNLLTNAIKYSPQANTVAVTLAAKGGDVYLSVTDFGIGIPKENQDHIFERFYRVSGKTHETVPGIGLGLYISNEIIKRLGGDIWVESKEGKGSTFTFCIPIQTTLRKKAAKAQRVSPMVD